MNKTGIKPVRIKCECCKDVLDINFGAGQIIFSMELDKWRLWGRVKWAFGMIFRPSIYKDGGTMWVSPERLKPYLTEIQEKNDKAILESEKWDKDNL